MPLGYFPGQGQSVGPQGANNPFMTDVIGSALGQGISPEALSAYRTAAPGSIAPNQFATNALQAGGYSTTPLGLPPELAAQMQDPRSLTPLAPQFAGVTPGPGVQWTPEMIAAAQAQLAAGQIGAPAPSLQSALQPDGSYGLAIPDRGLTPPPPPMPGNSAFGHAQGRGRGLASRPSFGGQMPDLNRQLFGGQGQGQGVTSGQRSRPGGFGQAPPGAPPIPSQGQGRSGGF